MVSNFYLQVFDKSPSDNILTHCKRELFQSIWMILLDNDFMDAYINGLMAECADGISR
jgi:hypothetical protein